MNAREVIKHLEYERDMLLVENAELKEENQRLLDELKVYDNIHKLPYSDIEKKNNVEESIIESVDNGDSDVNDEKVEVPKPKRIRKKKDVEIIEEN